MAPDGDGFRRVVASPEPGEIVEARTIALLVHAGVLVVCAGGGGIPVTSDDGVLRGVEAVVDKVAAALLARRARAQALLLLTDAAAIVRGERGTVVARDPAR
ncbi:MAG TPA: hypothetical protein VK923_15420 [Euzebyales bacterium]|nr:hypothetical protein [Euzebyales bacterium]